MSDMTEEEQRIAEERRQRECDEARQRLEDLRRKLDTARNVVEQHRDRVSGLGESADELTTSRDTVVGLIEESETNFGNANGRFQSVSEEWHKLEQDAGTAKEAYDEETQSVKIIGIFWYLRGSEYFDKRDAFRAIEPELESAREAKDHFREQLTERKDGLRTIESELGTVRESLESARSDLNDAEAHVNSILEKIEAAQIRVDANCG